jgi:hypothetical protein
MVVCAELWWVRLVGALFCFEIREEFPVILGE